jgi:hypothetical protein
MGHASSSSSSSSGDEDKKRAHGGVGVKLDHSTKAKSEPDLHLKVEGSQLGVPLSARGDAKVPKSKGGVHFGLDVTIPKFGNKDSSSSEDDGTGKRVKKAKGTKIGARATAPRVEVSVPHVGAEVDGGVDTHGKIGVSGEAGGKGELGLKMSKFGKSSRDSSSSSSEDDGHGNRVKKAKGGVSVGGKITGQKVEAKSNVPKPDLSVGGKMGSPHIGTKAGGKEGVNRFLIPPSPFRSPYRFLSFSIC